MKIHFAAVIGIEYDLDLAEYWIRYYKKCGFDSYTVFLHHEDGAVPSCVFRKYVNEGFNVHIVDGKFSDGKLRMVHLQNFARNLDRHDFLVTADADEFQALPNGEPIDYRMFLGKYDMLRGFLEDRYSDEPEDCVGDPFLQYYYIENDTGEYIKTVYPSYLRDQVWQPTVRTKILAARAGESVNFTGSHTITIVQSSARILENCKVIHFAWRRGSVRKFKTKSYLKENKYELQNQLS